MGGVSRNSGVPLQGAYRAYMGVFRILRLP